MLLLSHIFNTMIQLYQKPNPHLHALIMRRKHMKRILGKYRTSATSTTFITLVNYDIVIASKVFNCTKLTHSNNMTRNSPTRTGRWDTGKKL
ncbi:hypothetical protein M758_4G191900 [Ceratodon purpureus]|nr:hypothetical protein M758_4G191900 [Ceratodon purpureus]